MSKCANCGCGCHCGQSCTECYDCPDCNCKSALVEDVQVVDHMLADIRD
jgi:hypothetical protein